MTTLEIVFLALLLVSNGVWLFSHHRMVNKIMSRSFHEYQRASQIGTKPLVVKAASDDPLIAAQAGADIPFRPI